jgi:hypothetical protein
VTGPHMNTLTLDDAFVVRTRQRIQAAILPAMERIYLRERPFDTDWARPLKPLEQVVGFYDYRACGISVLARLAARGDQRALALMRIVQDHMTHYRERIYGHAVGDVKEWRVPLRRLLFHLALAYERLSPVLGPAERQWYRDLAEEQVPIAIAHCRGFLPGVTDLHLARVNNHTAIFMQGVYHCGRVFGRRDWQDLALDFAERYYADGHPDGYFEENTNPEREGGPSLVYTRLTAGCLYDVLDGRNNPRDKFIKAGRLFRSLVNHDCLMIPISDERTNSHVRGTDYGLALHSLTPQGRGFIVANLDALEFADPSPERLAVIDHELDLMTHGECAQSENCVDGTFRLTLPLGVMRCNGFTAGISALRALNREILPGSDYALDQQNMAYLAHRSTGVILTGVKSKNDPSFSTFRVGDDAYTVRTGELAMGHDWAEATLHYRTFAARLRWDISASARLTLSVGADEEVTTTLPTGENASLSCDIPHEAVTLTGFSPYSQGNIAADVNAVRFRWRKRLVIEFTA